MGSIDFFTLKQQTLVTKRLKVLLIILLQSPPNRGKDDPAVCTAFMNSSMVNGIRGAGNWQVNEHRSTTNTYFNEFVKCYKTRLAGTFNTGAGKFNAASYREVPCFYR